MHLQRLEIQGFKSFAEKTVFEFPEELTVIVGPNGSGKSNVADAIRWVLGEQSLKLLRGKKSADVIYHGSTKRSRIGMAQVDMYFENSDQRIPLEYSEVVISRRLYQSGESEYLINKNKVTLQEIIMILAKANFGQKSYAVIGQGTVENILNSTPQNRKDYFDEAAGVKQYQIKRDHALNKLLRTEENLKQTETLVAEIEPRLRSLERQVKKLERREILEKQLQELQVAYFGSHWSALANEHAKQQGEHATWETEQKKLEVMLQNATKKIDVLGKEKTRTENYHHLQNELNALQQQKNELVKKQTVLQGRMELSQETKGEMNLVWLGQKKGDVRAKMVQAQAEVQTIHGIITRRQVELEKKLGQQKQVSEVFQKMDYELLKAKEQLHQGTTITLPEVRQRLVTLYHQQEEFFQKLVATSDMETFQKLKKQGKDLTLRFAELVDALSDGKGEAQAKQQVESLTEAFHDCMKEKEKITNEIHENRVQLETKKAELAMTKRVFDAYKAEYDGMEAEMKNAEVILEKKDKEAKILEYRRQHECMQKDVDEVEKKIQTRQKEIDEFNTKEQAKKDELLKFQHEARRAQSELDEMNRKLQEVKIELTRIETKREDMQQEMERELTHDTLKKVYEAKEILTGLNEVEDKIARLKHQLELIGGIDPETVKEYEETKERFEFLSTQGSDLKEAMQGLEKIIDELDTATKKQFERAFRKINEHFTQYFKLLFNGGQAKLTLLTEEDNEDEVTQEIAQALENAVETKKEQELLKEDPETEHTMLVKNILKKQKKVISGVDIQAIPPGKKTKNIQALSGGEKALTALALLSAILEINPAPFVVLDEVEAALDEANSEKFAAILQKLSQKTQFIVITHNRVTMHHADVLFGVTMGDDGASRILSLKLAEAQQLEASKKIKTIV